MTVPVFLFGFARSGTTLLTMMMDSHPALCVPLSVTGLWYRSIAEANSSDIPALVDQLLSHERIALWNSTLDRDAIIQAIRPGHVEDVISAFNAAKAVADGKPRWAYMDIANLYHLPQLAQWFPTARFVHIVRDCRDVALSHQDYAFSEGNYLEIAEQWQEATLAAEDVGATLGQRYLVITFEDLVTDPARTLTRICGHIDLTFDDAMLHYAERVDGKIPKYRRGLWPDIDKSPQASNAGRWRTDMSQPARLTVERAASKALSHFGYDMSEITKPSLTTHLFHLFQNHTRGHRLQRVRQRLGLPQKKVRGSE